MELDFNEKWRAGIKANTPRHFPGCWAEEAVAGKASPGV